MGYGVLRLPMTGPLQQPPLSQSSAEKQPIGMFNKIKQAKQTSALKNEAISFLASEIESLYQQLESVPQDRVPGIKITRNVTQLKERLNDLLQPAGKRFSDLKEYTEILKFEVECKKLALERYAQLIPESTAITPFATYWEIYKTAAFTQPNQELNDRFNAALRALFTHPQFESTLLGRLNKKLAALVQNAAFENDSESARIRLFIENYDSTKVHNANLIKNISIETGIQELEAVIYFIDQTRLLRAGKTTPNDELAENINHWMHYLNELSAEQQQQKMPLIQAADWCSEAYNAALTPA